MPGITLPMVCLAAAIAALVYRHAARQEVRLHVLFVRLARRHIARDKDLARREAEADRRDRALNLMRFVTECASPAPTRAWTS